MQRRAIEAGPWHHAVEVDAQPRDHAHAVSLPSLHGPVDQRDAPVEAEFVEKRGLLRQSRPDFSAAAINTRQGKWLDRPWRWIPDEGIDDAEMSLEPGPAGESIAGAVTSCAAASVNRASASAACG